MAKNLTIAQIQDAEITKWSKKELEENLPQMIKKFNNRARSFSNKKNQNVFSYALDKMEDWIDHNSYAKAGVRTVKMPKETGENLRDFNRKQAMAFRLQEFFRSETASVEGARRIARQQDIDIFGKNARGNPAHRMNSETRKKFWTVFDEFLNQNPQWSQSSFRARDIIGTIARDGILDVLPSSSHGVQMTMDFQLVLDEARRRYQNKIDGVESSASNPSEALQRRVKYEKTILKRGRHGR